MQKKTLIKRIIIIAIVCDVLCTTISIASQMIKSKSADEGAVQRTPDEME